VGIPESWFWSVVLRLLAYPMLVYCAIGAYLYVSQGSLLFPAPKTFEKTTPAQCGLSYEDLRIPVNAKDAIHGWWIPSATPSSKVIIVFHGNGYVLEEMVPEEVTSLHEIGANLLLVDYRGYGSSSRISPNEITVNEDAEAAIQWLLGQRKIPEENIFLLGRSIGSGPATYLAAKYRGLAGLILESPFSSIDDAVPSYFHIYPLRLMLRTHFDNLSRVASVQAPILIISGTADTLTPTWMAEKLFAHAHQPKQLYLVPNAGHNDLLAVGRKRLLLVLQKFVGP
jgi:fermentation-respiration switch protein FrsA (DUF1100 family)